MPALVYPTADYVQFERITSAALNNKLNAVKTLLNTTGLDDDNIQDGGITGSDKLVDLSVTEGKLGTGSVTTDKLGAGAVTGDKLAASAVDDTTIEISDSALQIKAAGVGSTHLGTTSLDPKTMLGVGLSAVAAAGAMTLRTKQPDATTDLSATAPMRLAFRSTTVTVGGFSIQDFEASESLVIPSTATLGFAAGERATVYVYAMYDGTNKEIGVTTGYLNEATLHTSVAIDVASDSLDTLYSTNARSNCAVRLVGVVEIDPITTAGTWIDPTLVAVGAAAEYHAEYLKSLTYAFLATSNNGQAGMGASSFQRIEFEDEVYDYEGAYNVSTGEYVCKKKGLYTFGAMIMTAAVDLETAGDDAEAAFFKTPFGGAAAEFYRLDYDECDDPNSAREWCFQGDIQIELNYGDKIDVRGNQTDDVACNLQANGLFNRFWGRRIK